MLMLRLGPLLFSAAVVVLVPVAGCQSAEQACAGRGLASGSPAFAECEAQRAAQHQAAIAQGREILRENGAALVGE